MMSLHRVHSELAHRQSRRWATLLTARSGPCSPSELLVRARGLLDEAHRELPEAELADVLLATEALAAPLADGLAIQPSSDRLVASGSLSPAVRVYVRPLEVLLADTGSYSPARRRRLAAELTCLVEQLASRPRGGSVPAG